MRYRKLINLKDVVVMTSFIHSEIYNFTNEWRFTKQICLNNRAVVWIE
ncbi:AlpA family phage regulatory protein [Photorhabdus luminescens]|uniref:AlpA family phage regulatory protein n=1 Tax=Photorhabdus luminescens subsp. sonorensis TaxID=1173677 RepID=A0A5C4RN16_PHOLU|nr:AlpA family phage regulatory protein [Photorhabdus luminescens subsp. sonorensis]